MFVRVAAVLIALALLLVPSLSAEAGGKGSSERLARLLPPHARWALVVVDLRSGRETALLGNAHDEPLIPGSLVKLFVTGGVLDRVEQGERAEAFLPPGSGRGHGRKAPAAVRLQRLLRDMNVHSRNRTAERLFLRLGELRFGGEPTREKGGQAVEEFLAGLGLPPGGVTLADGSGLSREDRVPARFVARYLVAISGKPWFGRFRETLPRAGLEGTVKDIGYADSRFRVKSGRLDDAFALAGYGVAPGGREVAFAFIVNAHGGRKISDRRHSRGMVVRMIAQGAFK